MPRKSILILTFVLAGCFGVGEPAWAQFNGWSPAERVLWLGLGSRRVSSGEFMRTMYALQTMDRANIARQQQYLQQQIAAQRARADQSRLRGIMSSAPVGEVSPYAANPSAVESPEQRQEASDFLLCWEVLGCTFDAVEIDAVRAVDPKLDAGLRVAAIKLGGPVDKANWQAGDILVGLYKYRVRSYDNAAYVADLPDLVGLSPMRALLVRDGKLVDLPLDFRSTPEADVATPGTSNAPTKAQGPPTIQPQVPSPPSPVPSTPKTDKQPPTKDGSAIRMPASPISALAEPGRIVPTSNDEPLTPVPVEPKEAEKSWDQLGARFEAVSVENLGGKYDRGMELTEIRPNGPAAHAGWTAGSVLLGLGGFQTRSERDLDYVLGETARSGAVDYVLLAGKVVRRGKISTAVEPSNADKRP